MLMSDFDWFEQAFMGHDLSQQNIDSHVQLFTFVDIMSTKSKHKHAEPVLILEGVSYYDLQGVAEWAGVSRQTLWQWRSRGAIPLGRKHRNRLLFTRDEAELVVRHAARLEPATGSSALRYDGLRRRRRVILIYSGGLDSTVLLYSLLADGHEVFALSIDYGQRHKRELDAARTICASLNVTHEVADCSGLQCLLAGSSLTSASVAVPDGHYAEETMKQTIVPNRNMIMLAIAGGWALSQKCEAVAYAAHGGDHAIYPDCRHEFTEAVDKALRLADWQELYLWSPFVNRSKADIVRLGDKLGVPFEQTWSCYKGGRTHCGRCGTCVERREAFYLAGVKDPTKYSASAPSIQAMVDNAWRIPA